MAVRQAISTIPTYTVAVERQQADRWVVAWSAGEQSNPWLNVAGKYEEDEQFDEMLDHIAAYRRELDAEAGMNLSVATDADAGRVL